MKIEIEIPEDVEKRLKAVLAKDVALDAGLVLRVVKKFLGDLEYRKWAGEEQANFERRSGQKLKELGESLGLGGG